MFQINDWSDVASILGVGSIVLGSFYGIVKFIEQVNQLAKTVKEIGDSSSSTHGRIFRITDDLKDNQKTFDKRLSLVEHDLAQAGITTIPEKYNNKKEEET